MTEDNHLTARLKRYAHVTTSLGGSAARLIGYKVFGGEIDHALQAKALGHALGQLKGPVMKIAQLLSTVPDAVPDVYVQEFTHLQSTAPSMGWPFVRRRMQAELGANWQQKFAAFESVAAAAASLGQVHQATSHTGIRLACKLQFPDMTSNIHADLAQLKILLKFYETTFQAVKVDEVYQEIADRLFEELDYELEAKRIAVYQHIFKNNDLIHVPFVEKDLSTSRLLTMHWLDGKSVGHLLEAPQAFKNEIAATLFKAWYQPFYGYGLIHGDPHLGNYSFQADGSVNLFDFGCVREFRSEFIASVIDIYYAFLHNQPDRAIAAYEKWGFKDLSKDMIEVLNVWAKMLYEPLLEDRIRPIQAENRGLEGRAKAEFVHKELRRLGGIRPPREFVFMDRAAVGIGSAFMHLKAEQNWHQLFHTLIEDFDIKKVNQRQQDMIRSIT